LQAVELRPVDREDEALGADGQALAYFGPNITEGPGGAWRFELSPLNPPVKAEIVVAGQVDRQTLPVRLTPR